MPAVYHYDKPTKGLTFSNRTLTLNAGSSIKGQTEATVTVWYYPIATPSANTAIYHESANFSTHASRLTIYHQSNGTLLAAYRDSTTDAGGTPVTLNSSALSVGKWHHIAITYSSLSELFILYINGVEIGRNTVAKEAFATTDPATAVLGYYAGTGGFLNGVLSDFRIYTSYKNAEGINRIMKGRVDLLGLHTWFQFNEATGTTVIDSSPNLFNGTLSSSVERINTEIHKGIISINRLGNYFKFSQKSGGFPLDPKWNYQPSSTFSISVICRVNVLPTANIGVLGNFNGNSGWRLGILNSGIVNFYFYQNVQGNHMFWGNSYIPPVGQIIQIGFTKAVGQTTNDGKIYFNGYKTGNNFGSTITGDVAGSAVAIAQAGNALDIDVYSFRTYNRELTGAEMLQLWASDNLAPISGLTGGCDFDQKSGFILNDVRESVSVKMGTTVITAGNIRAVSTGANYMAELRKGNKIYDLNDNLLGVVATVWHNNDFDFEVAPSVSYSGQIKGNSTGFLSGNVSVADTTLGASNLWRDGITDLPITY